MNQRELFLRHVAQTSDTPMMGIDIDVVSAQGCELTASDGKVYTDLISGISVSSVGHCHPEVVKAVKDQAEKYMHLMVYGEFNQQPQREYASKLAQYLPESLSSVYFTTGGSEAVEGAMKLAKRHTGRNEIISFENAYHGSTQGALSIMGSEFFRNAYRPLIPGTLQLPYNDVESLKNITSSTAAVFIEPIQGEAGIRPAHPEFMKALRKRCNETGALLVMDEIQTGFGRCGSLFAFQKLGVVPDVLLIAKGMGGGMPIGAFIASHDIMQSLTHNPVLGHINTFGGNAVCVAAATATLTVVTRENLWMRAMEIESEIRNFPWHSRVKEVRCVGALAALEFEDEAFNLKVVKQCIERGIITDWFLFRSTAMRLAPPLVISKEMLRQSLEIIQDVIASL